ncbi:tyrosine-type recombinase/integrase [Devosia sp.]|uniref:tyrosine-type recombinase/integrase n=1 Tax=Devosia sp. TaxID=1871048 RepID=UPI003F70E237
MAKRVRDALLDTRTAREKLPAQGKPYYRSLGPGLHIGYRKGKTDGVWVARLYLGGQNYKVEKLTQADDRLDANGTDILDFWQAQDKARELHRQRSTGTGEIVGPYTVKRAIDDYIQWMEGNRRTARDARYNADALILPELGHLDVARLTATVLRDWQRKVSETPARVRTRKGEEQNFKTLPAGDPDAVRRRRATANRVLAILKAALNHAWRERKVASDTEWRRVMPFKGVDVARVRYLTVAEAQRLVNASTPAFRSLVQAALQTGARYSELGRLRVEDFNRDAGTLTIRVSKTGRPRHVVLTDEGIELFRQLVTGKPSDALILTNAAGNAWGTGHQKEPIKAACTAARIEPAISFHILRHTWASLSVMNGVVPMVVARNLGHTDTRMVEKHYGHLSQSYVADAIRAGAPRFGTGAESTVVAIDGART